MAAPHTYQGEGMSVIPEMVALSEVAKQLGKSSHVLVRASQRGKFVPLVRVGAKWYARAELLREWFAADHSSGPTPAEIAALKAAGEDRR